MGLMKVFQEILAMALKRKIEAIGVDTVMIIYSIGSIVCLWLCWQVLYKKLILQSKSWLLRN
jgi:hypothetical protein